MYKFLLKIKLKYFTSSHSRRIVIDNYIVGKGKQIIRGLFVEADFVSYWYLRIFSYGHLLEEIRSSYQNIAINPNHTVHLL